MTVNGNKWCLTVNDIAWNHICQVNTFYAVRCDMQSRKLFNIYANCEKSIGKIQNQNCDGKSWRHFYFYQYFLKTVE